MSYSPILVPVVALVAWTLVVMLLDAGFATARVRRDWGSPSQYPAPGRAASTWTAKPPDEAQWKSHNYNHLMEQPTIFYAIALTLALMDMGGGINYWLAWGYVGFRIVHSLVQCTVNIVALPFPLFALASLCLLGLTVHAGARILHDCLGWCSSG